MIRVLQVFGIMNRGGAENMIMNIYRKIDKSKLQFDFVVHHKKRGEFDSEIIELGGKIFCVPQFKGYNLFQYMKWWKVFFAENPEYKIIHSHIRSTAFIFIPIAKHNGIISIIHSHSTSEGKNFEGIVKRLFEYPLRWECDYYIGCSKEAGNWLFGNKIVNSNKYRIIKNAVDLNRYSLNDCIRQDYRNKLGITNNLVFIHIGRMEEVKNHFFLIDIFKGIKSKIDTAKLLLVGDGNLKDSIKEYVEKEHLSKDILFLGIRDDVPKLLMSADCFLLPSKWEGLPLSVIEAQAAGLPCFVSDRVSNEVKATRKLIFLPISRGAKLWVDRIVKSDFSRKETRIEMEEKGYDVESVAYELQQYYLEILEQNNKNG